MGTLLGFDGVVLRLRDGRASRPFPLPLYAEGILSSSRRLIRGRGSQDGRMSIDRLRVLCGVGRSQMLHAAVERLTSRFIQQSPRNKLVISMPQKQGQVDTGEP